MQFPEDILAQAIQEDSVDKLKNALDLARSLYTDESGDSSYAYFVNTALDETLSKPSLPLLEHLLSSEQVEVEAAQVSKNPSRELVDALVAHGWDVNRAGPQDQVYQGKRLIDYLCGSCDHEDLARWLVEAHGARVDGGWDDSEYEVIPMPPPVLESCGKTGPVSLFRFMQERGAKLSRRTLHQSVLFAAEAGADPNLTSQVEGSGADRLQARAEMLRFLVDEVGLDVSAMDSEQNHGLKHWGSPVCYAATAKKGAPVVKWLLDKGSDPTVKGLYTGQDAWDIAKANQCDDVLKVLDEWKALKSAV